MTKNKTCEELEQRIKELEKEVVSRKKAEEAWREAHDELEVQIQAGTAEIMTANKELKQRIEERNQALKAMRESEEKYRTILQSIGDGYYEVDIAGNFNSINDSMSKIFGYSRDELPGMNYRRFMDRENSEKAYKIVNRVYRTGKPAKGFEHEIIRKDKSKRHIEVSVSAIKDSNGLPSGFRGIMRDITERKRAEEALKSEKEKFRILVEESPFGVSLVAQDGQYQYFNPRFAEMLGYTLEDIPTGREWFKKAYPDQDYRRQVISTWVNDRKKYKVGESRARTFTVTCKNGSEKVIHFRPVTIGLGEQLVIYEDITERKRAEEALRESEDRFRTLAENAPFGISIMKPDKSFEYINKEFTRVLGYTIKDLPHKETWFEKAYPRQQYRKMVASTWNEDFVESLKTGEVRARVFRVRCKNGQEKIINFRPVDLKDGKQFLTYEDITDRARAEEELQQSEKRYRALVEESFDGIFVQKGSKIVFANRRFREMLGYSEGELLGLDHWLVYHPDYQKLTTSRAQARMRGEMVPSQYEVKLQRKDGSWFHGEVSARAINIDGSPGVQVWARDISERKRAEEALRNAHDELEKRVQERTEDLAKANEELSAEISHRKRVEVELQKSKEAAVAANSAKSEFLANMSHELRTPLNHIIGFTELVVGKNFGDLNETQEEYLNDVLQSGKHLLSLINDILDLSKVEAGKHELELTDVNPKILLDNSLIMIKEKAMKHRIKLATDIQDITETIITADERKLKQIMYNLLSNAVKFTPDGGEVCLSARMVDCIVRPGLRRQDPEDLQIIEGGIDGSEVAGMKRKKCIEISLSDTGIGISPEDQERIFNPFEQVDSSAGRRYQGTGLGLSLTKKLVEMHGGRLWVESEGEGKGSTFRFVIPT